MNKFQRNDTYLPEGRFNVEIIKATINELDEHRSHLVCVGKCIDDDEFNGKTARLQLWISHQNPGVVWNSRELQDQFASAVSYKKSFQDIVDDVRHATDHMLRPSIVGQKLTVTLKQNGNYVNAVGYNELNPIDPAVEEGILASIRSRQKSNEPDPTDPDIDPDIPASIANFLNLSKDHDLTDIEKLVGAVIYEYYDESGTPVSSSNIARDTQLQDQEVKDAIANLLLHGLIDRTGHATNGKGYVYVKPAFQPQPSPVSEENADFFASDPEPEPDPDTEPEDDGLGTMELYDYTKTLQELDRIEAKLLSTLNDVSNLRSFLTA